MKNKIIGIVLIVAAVLTAVLGLMAGGNASGNSEIIKNAVYISDGKVLPENEGKVVIVSGTLDAPLPYVDQETGIKLSTIVAYRHVEKLRVGEDTETKTLYWDWDLVMDTSILGGTEKLIAPDVTLGEFLVDEQLLQALSASQGRTEYTDDKELNQLGWNVFKDGSNVYLYQGDRMPRADEDVTLYNEIDRVDAYKDYVGSLRVTYDEMDGGLSYTIIGLQKDGRLVKAEDLDLLAVHPGQMTMDDLVGYAESSASTVTIGVIIAAVVLLGVGVFFIIKKDKKHG